MKAATATKLKSAGLTALGNPVVQTALALAAVALVAWFAWAPFRNWFEGLIDGVLSSIADILGRPESQVPDERTWWDNVRGVFAEGDRALSDIID